MGLMYKQLTGEIFKNKIFVLLLLILTLLTSLSFFFVKFSIDGNLAALNAQSYLTENQLLYQNALNSNTLLAYNFLAASTGLTAFVFIMFFYRFFRSNRKQMGSLKALGFRDSALRNYFVVFTVILSIIGALLGMAGGYFLSGVLLNANTQTYSVTGIVKSVSPLSAVIGLMGAAAVFSIVAFICYGFIRRKDPGELIAGAMNRQSYNISLRTANAISGILPVKNKFPFRIALRKPIAVLLVFAAVMAFSVCLILGRSLNISSQKVIASQTDGRGYNYDISYRNAREGAAAAPGSLSYLELQGKVGFGKTELEHKVIALYDDSSVFTLKDESGKAVRLPGHGSAVIGPGLEDTYDLQAGETITVSVGGRRTALKVSAVAANAKTASIYMFPADLAELAGLPAGSYNGELRVNRPGVALPTNAQVITEAEHLEELERSATSNKVSAVINQAAGVLIGCILIFLALYVNVQDNTRDILILHLMGYKNRAIRKMLVNVYQPIVWTAFIITLAPSIWLAQTIQRSLSIATNDYMPFGTNAFIALAAFIGITVIYLLVQAVFSLGIKRIITKEEITEYTAE